MQISPYVTLIWITAIMIGSLDAVIYWGSKNLSSRAFAHSILWVTIWISSVGLFVGMNENNNPIFFERLPYFLGSTIATSFLYFFLTYPDDKKPSNTVKFLLIGIQLLFAYIFLLTDNIVYSTFTIPNSFSLGWTFGSLSSVFEIAFFGFFGAGIIILYKKYLKCTNPNTKKNLKYMLWVIIVGSTPPSLMCIILPRFGIFHLNWLGPITELIWIPILSYSILKYRQMDIRVAATKVFVIAMVMMSILNIFIDFVFGIYGRVALFVAFVALGYYIFQSLQKEAAQKEELTLLNSTLSQKVAEQTAEIRKAFELEKHARRELEKLNETKDQFIMITQHHLRTPVTNIRWQLEALLSGTYGKVSTKLGQALHDTNTSVGRLTRIVDDFLNIAALKVGSQILNIEKSNLKPLVKDVLQELKIDIEKKRLSVDYPHDTASWPDLEIDASKMREVLLITLENAVKYNVDDGKIEIKTRLNDDHTFELIIENTGVGLTTEDKEKLFTRHFFRSSRAQAANPIGMGIGLSVARAVVRAHKGELTIESDGEGKGAKVTIKLMM